VGKNPLPRIEAYNDANIQIVGPVDDIYQEIASAMFVILPIRVASGTRTRILEAASQAKAVITTPIGAEGFDFTSREITIAENASSFLKAVQNLLSDTKLRDELGENLFRASVSRYAQGVVVKGFIDLLNGKVQNHKPQVKALKLAIITNRFFPEVGGAETNIYYQAKLLAKHHQLTVLCPKRSTSPTAQNHEGFRIIRYNDLLNRENRFPNLKSKTLCPGMILHLALSRYDIIQCYPALNYNNMLAYLIARIKGIKYILCFFDFMDYAAHIRKHKKIEPEILKNIKPRFYQLPILRGMDYAFAIAEREIKFLKQYNPNVDYSPVPVLLQEYETAPKLPDLFGKLPENSFVFLCLGRVSYIKGQDIALRAFRKAHELMPDAKLIFVGRTDYEPEYFKELEALSSDPLLVDKVFFTGQLTRQEVLSFLHYSDIHIIPVRFMNSGAVVVESWFSNTPVLQSNVVDPNLVIEDINGYLFDSESIDTCAQKMIKAYTNREALPDLAQKGKELVREKYTYEYLISLYNKTYSKLLDYDDTKQ